MRPAFPIAVAAGLLAMLPWPAGAQSATSPPGSVQGLVAGGDAPNPARTSQQLSLWFDFGGGYDQNSNLGGTPGTGDLAGFATTGVGALRYWRGRTTRSVEAVARVFRNEQRAAQTTATGGEVNLTSNMQFGRRSGMNVSLRAANDSALLFGAFGPPAAAPGGPVVDPEIDVPDVSPQRGIVEDRWFSVGGSATAFHGWSVRHRTSAQYSQVHREPTDRNDLDSDQHYVNLRHDWMFGMNTGLLGAYRFERVRQSFPDTPDLAPVRTQSVEAGVRWDRRFSPIRTLQTSAQAGVSQILVDGAQPDIDGSYQGTGSLTASYTLTRRWALSASAMRGISVLQGVAQVPFRNDVAALSLTGIVARQVTVVVSGSFSQGSAVGTAPGAFDAVGGTATVRYAFRYGGLFAGYTRYEHRLREITTVAGGIAPRFNQSSIRAGVTLWLPIIGGF